MLHARSSVGEVAEAARRAYSSGPMHKTECQSTDGLWNSEGEIYVSY
jgi:hypothetical protein